MADAKAGARDTPFSATHVVMGRIGAPYGIKGWVKLLSFADDPDNLLDYRYFYIVEGEGKADQALRKIEIDESRPQGPGFVGHIKGCDDRDETRAYTGKDLLLPKAELPDLDEGYYWHQLEGLRVVNRAGQDLGTVDHLMGTGANDVLVVRGDAQSIDREERLLPYVEGQVVTEVNLAAGLIRVDWEADWGQENS